MIAALFGQRSGRIGFQSDRMSLKTSDNVRFSNSSCPVPIHHASLKHHEPAVRQSDAEPFSVLLELGADSQLARPSLA
jgi:hypothetical protein